MNESTPNPLTHWLKGRVIRLVLDGPRLPGRMAEILFNWAMREYQPRRVEGGRR